MRRLFFRAIYPKETITDIFHKEKYDHGAE